MFSGQNGFLSGTFPAAQTVWKMLSFICGDALRSDMCSAADVQKGRPGWRKHLLHILHSNIREWDTFARLQSVIFLTVFFPHLDVFTSFFSSFTWEQKKIKPSWLSSCLKVFSFCADTASFPIRRNLGGLCVLSSFGRIDNVTGAV